MERVRWGAMPFQRKAIFISCNSYLATRVSSSTRIPIEDNSKAPPKLLLQTRIYLTVQAMITIFRLQLSSRHSLVHGRHEAFHPTIHHRSQSKKTAPYSTDSIFTFFRCQIWTLNNSSVWIKVVVWAKLTQYRNDGKLLTRVEADSLIEEIFNCFFKILRPLSIE